MESNILNRSNGSSFKNVVFRYADKIFYLYNSTVDFENVDVSQSSTGFNVSNNSKIKIINADIHDLDKDELQNFNPHHEEVSKLEENTTPPSVVATHKGHAFFLSIPVPQVLGASLDLTMPVENTKEETKIEPLLDPRVSTTKGNVVSLNTNTEDTTLPQIEENTPNNEIPPVEVTEEPKSNSKIYLIFLSVIIIILLAKRFIKL
ncbi:MAG: hypothetical protein M3P22_02575 [bacterium]|nr:hypothetical protein [bacterium]